ncbi:MAG: ferrochelatase [bacterium]|nr:ferrochelatase [bacterium]
MNTVKENKIAVLLLAFGGPASFEEVEPFIKNVTGGRIPSDKIQEVVKRYEQIGGKSPLLEITRKQAKALEDSLNKTENIFSVFVGMRYWHPFIADTVKQIISENIVKIIVLPMTPYYSRISTEGYLNDFIKSFSEFDNKINYTFIKSYHKQPLFIKAFSELIIEEKNKFADKDLEIIFSVHSIPKKFIDDGDPYLSQIKETIEAILNNTGFTKYHLAFQSKGASPGEWLEPDVSNVLRKIKDTNKKNVLLVPVGFICDHIETLYDIDVIYKNEAQKLGLNFRRTPSLNVNPIFIESLKELIKMYV